MRLWQTALAVVWALSAPAFILGVEVSSPPELAQTVKLPLEMPLRGYGLVPALGELRFASPVALASAPGETNRLFIVERTGRVLVVTNLARPTTSVFLDLREKTSSEFSEAGLLGLAFHPSYATNGYFYVFRSLIRSTVGNRSTLHQQVSRFQSSATNANEAEPESELPLIAQADSSAEHNGGDLKFGPDGYLYISFGETGPPANTRSEQPQPIDNGFFGAIARIDVDLRPSSLRPNPHPASSGAYAIPPDNPFVGLTQHNGVAVSPERVRTEFYAIGLRNPWRMSFDPETGVLLCGDVGGSEWEEVNRITKGGNYGWPYSEGKSGAPPANISIQEPLLAYPHGYGSRQGLAVIGGVFYYGKNISELRGAYVFGDYGAGNIWALHLRSGEEPDWQYLSAERGISTLGLDPSNGDILVANHVTGTISRLVYIDPDNALAIPETLEATGLFSNLRTLEPRSGVLPYTINAPFWSDNALKTRWFWMPEGSAKIGFDATGNWQFPPGMIWIKHFNLELTEGVSETRRRIETRVLVKSPDGVYGLTYRWGRSLTNAMLVPEEGFAEDLLIRDGGIIRTQTWQYPSRTQCRFCHTPQAGLALGFNTAQLNRPGEGGQPGNQLQFLIASGCMESETELDPRLLPSLASSDNALYPLGYRARSYLMVNCSPCHQPGASGEATWDARMTTPLSLARLINAHAVYPLDATVERPARRIVPHSAEKSMIIQWMNRRGVFQMPPIATTLIDTNGIELLARWIHSMPPQPWLDAPVGASALEGYSEVQRDAVLVSASAYGLPDAGNSAHLLGLPLPENGHLIARLEEFHSASPPAKAGLIGRLGLNPEDPYLAVLSAADGSAYLRRRTKRGAEIETRQIGAMGPLPWMRILRQETALVAYVSADRTRWSVVGTLPMTGEPVVSAGPAVVPSDGAAFSTARFTDFERLSVSVAEPGASRNYSTPGEIPIRANVLSSNAEPVTVEFLAGLESIGESSRPPYELVWKNPTAGVYQLRARITDKHGTAVVSAPIEVTIALARAIAQFRQLDAGTLGNWRGVYGDQGYSIPGGPQNLSSGIVLDMSENATVFASEGTDSESALQWPAGAARIASTWTGEGSLSLALHLNDAQLHEVALYFADTFAVGSIRQRVEVFDSATGTLLDARTVEDFSRGHYLVWSLRGDVRIEITSVENTPAVLSGVFLARAFNRPPTVTLQSPGTQRARLPVELSLQATAADLDGFISRVDFLDGATVLGSVQGSPFLLAWPNPRVGKHRLMARAFDDLGEYTDSQPVEIHLEPAAPAAEFVGIDPLTQGNWQARYSALLMAGSSINYSADAVGLETGDVFVWGQFVDKPEALRNVANNSRTAAAWSGEKVRLRIDFSDGVFHPVSLYFLDWDKLDRIQDVIVLDPTTESVLDKRTVASFALGRHYLWNLRGAIAIEIRPQTINAVLSGVFLDRIPDGVLRLNWLPPTAAAEAVAALQAPTGSAIQLNFSTDLKTWSPWSTNTVPESGWLVFPDLVRPDADQTFYRAELLPAP